MKIRRGRVRGLVAASAALVFFFGVECRGTGGDATDLESAASDAAAAILKSAKGHKPRILVIDFAEGGSANDQVGQELASYFARELSRHGPRLDVVGQKELLQITAADKLAPESFADTGTMMCYQPQIQATDVISGKLDLAVDTALLRIEVSHIRAARNPKDIFTRSITLSLTPEMRANLSALARPTQPTSAEATAGGLPVAGKDGYSSPSCIYCPPPHPSDGALKSRVRGTVVLQASISASGEVGELTVTYGLPCGLTKAAIEAVRGWQLHPAIAPDGRPASVQAAIDVEFHMY